MTDHEKLLAAALDDGSGTAFAQRAAAHARRRRQHGRMVLLSAAAAACAAVALFSLSPGTSPDAGPAARSTPPPYEAMSDRELLEKLGEHPVLVLRERGEISGIVFLPATSKSESGF